MILTYHHEPTNDVGNRGCPDAATYVKAWRRFRSVLDAAGVDNALYMTVSIGYDLRSSADPERWYPGSDVIDVVAADVYNWPPRPGAKWIDLSQIAVHAVRFATDVDRPLFLAEWGTNENPQRSPSKAAWFRNARSFIKGTPIIKGVEYFHNEHENNGIVNRWIWDSSPAALRAMRELTSDPYFASFG